VSAVAQMRWDAPFEALEVGQAFTTETRTVTEADVVAFAGLTGDHHPQHIDAAWAADSRFGEQIAHGMLVLSLAVGLVPLDPGRVVALRRVSDVVFKRPVPLGARIAVAGTLTRLRAVTDDAGLVTWAWVVSDGDGRTVVAAQVEVLWRRGAEEA
jgi:acyl dehydratase